MQTHIPRLVIQSKRSLPAASLVVVLLTGMFTSASADEPTAVRGGPSFWSIDTQASAQLADSGAALLRPPASWSWDRTQPVLDFAAGLEQHFANGLSLSAGVSVAQPVEVLPLNVNYRDYFLGVRYGSLDSKVWYLPETLTEPSALYYDAGWRHVVVHEALSVSVRLGHYGSAGAFRAVGDPLPSLSIGATTSLAGYGLGLRLIDGGGQLFGGDQDMRLMGSISRPLK